MDHLWITLSALTVGVGIYVFASLYSLSERQFVTQPSLEYDFVIVGGGTAGGVLANRLSADGRATVLVLEAGGLNTWFGYLPLVSPILQESSVDWRYLTEPQTNSSWGLNGKQSKWPRGKGLGGSSLINFMVHLRGIRSDYDRWNCSEFSYSELLPFFAVSETVDETPSDSYGLRGSSGPLLVSRNNCSNSMICSAFLKSMEDSGYELGDLNGDVSHGAMPVEYNVFQGKRFSVSDAYIKPVLDRPNLHVMINTFVQKILFGGGEGRPRATGVQFKHGNAVLMVGVRKEVLVCAGVINTPHLLQVSGIGKQAELQKHSIKPIRHLPVGDNLQDHLNLPIFIQTQSGKRIVPSLMSLNTFIEYALFNAGPLVKNSVSAVARIRVPCPEKSCNETTLLIFALDVGSVNSRLYSQITNIKMSTFQKMFPDAAIRGKEGFIMMLIGAHPESKGHVRLGGNDAPIIQPNYLREMADVRSLSYGIRFIASLMDKEPMKAIGARMHLPQLQECHESDRDLEDDDFLECWIRTAAITTHHPIGTCPMGAGGTKEAVVDCKLNVDGVEALRVVDASVFPNHISGAPQATVVALAERAAQMIIAEHEND